ncbi:MAG: hypothetical protein R3B95_19260 [Nitrospirales bacterium]|nr:hypothetical protein [Nitrospirales bacterium]
MTRLCEKLLYRWTGYQLEILGSFQKVPGAGMPRGAAFSYTQENLKGYKMTQLNDKRTVGVTALSRLLGCSRQSIYRSEKDGRISRESDGFFDPSRVRRDWVNRTRMKIDSHSTRMSGQDSQRDQVLSESKAIAFIQLLQGVWAHSLNGMAQVLRDVGGLSPKIAYKCLGTQFLLQWNLLSEFAGLDWDSHAIEMTGDMQRLLSASGLKSLEQWLAKQPPIEWDKEDKPKERIVNGKSLTAFNKGGSRHAKN